MFKKRSLSEVRDLAHQVGQPKKKSLTASIKLFKIMGMMLIALFYLSIGKVSALDCSTNTSSGVIYITSGTINPSQPIMQNLVVQSGTNVTLSSKMWNFGVGFGIIVEAGGTLTLENCHFNVAPTPGVNYPFWGGILVKGLPSSYQRTGGMGDGPNLNTGPGGQGILYLKDNTIIEKASIGVSVGSTGGLGSNCAGGIVRSTTGTNFKNCKKAAYLYPYNKPNYSYFKDTRFEWSEFLNETKDFKASDIIALVTLERVEGVYFAGGNTFINTIFHVFFNNIYSDYQLRGYGIMSLNSSFTTKRSGPCFENLALPEGQRNCWPCSGDRNHFEGLLCGIVCEDYAINQIERTVEIAGCKFQNVISAIYANEVKNLFILNNLFNIDNDIYNYSSLSGVGGASGLGSITHLASGIDIQNVYHGNQGNVNNKLEIILNFFNYFVDVYTPYLKADNITPFCQNNDNIAIKCVNGAKFNNSSVESYINNNTINIQMRPEECNKNVNAINLSGDNYSMNVACNRFGLDNTLYKLHTVVNHDRVIDWYMEGGDNFMIQDQGDVNRPAENYFSVDVTWNIFYDGTPISNPFQWFTYYWGDGPTSGDNRFPAQTHINDGFMFIIDANGANYENQCFGDTRCRLYGLNDKFRPYLDYDNTIDTDEQVDIVFTGEFEVLDDYKIVKDQKDLTFDIERGNEKITSELTQEAEVVITSIYDQVNINYNLHQNINNCRIIVSDILGRRVGDFPLNSSQGIVTVQTNKISGGILVYQIISSDKILKSGKIIIYKN